MAVSLLCRRCCHHFWRRCHSSFYLYKNRFISTTNTWNFIKSLMLLFFYPLTENFWNMHTSLKSKMPYFKFYFWNRIVQIAARRTVHGMFFFGSFHRVTVTGRQATAKEAPILVLAPHSSFFDSISVILFGPPSVLAKAETASLPFLGSKFVILNKWLAISMLITENLLLFYFNISIRSVYRIDKFHAANLCETRRSKFTTKND